MTETNLLPSFDFPSLQPCSLDDILNELIRTHGDGGNLPLNERVNISAQSILGLLMLDVPVFSASMLYEVLQCDISYKAITKGLSSLVARKYVKSVRIDSDPEFRVVYYLTKAGYTSLASRLGNCREFQSKTGKRLMETAVHDYGVGCTYLALVRSPFSVYPQYEVSTMFDKAAMPTGKFLKRSLRPDAIMQFESEKTFGKFYVEHDTNSESAQRMIDKLNLYYSHELLYSTLNGKQEHSVRYEQNMVLYTFRKSCGKRPLCFSVSALKRLIETMGDDDLVADVKDESFALLVRDLRYWTPAIKRRWKKENLVQFAKDVDNRTDRFLIRYQKYYQRNASASRRNSAIKILMEEYALGEKSVYYSSIREMLEGFPVGFCSVNNLENLLPVLFMEDYPQTIEWLKRVLFPYYGEISYRDRRIMFPSNKSGERTLCMSNIFATSTGELLSVEYFSGDLSAIMRMYAIFTFTYDLSDMPFKCILIVDSVKDANNLLTLMAPDFKQGAETLHHGKLYDIVFLNVNGEHLYTISRDNQEVRVDAS